MIDIGESKSTIMDPTVAIENIEIAKKKKAYELNRNFQDNGAMKLLWIEFLLSSSGEVVQVQCKVCKWMKGIDKLLVPMLDSLWKHASCCNVLVAMLGVKVGDHYFLKTNSMW